MQVVEATPSRSTGIRAALRARLQSAAVFFLCPPILSEAELQWGAEKRPPQGSMAFWPGWSWGRERKDGYVKGGQLFREQTVM